MVEHFFDRLRSVVAKYEVLVNMPPWPHRRLPRDAAAPGVYLLSEGEKHFFVGSAKNLRERIMQYTPKEAGEALFAFRRACELRGLQPSAMAKRFRPQLLMDEEFRKTFEEQRHWALMLDVRYVLEGDPVNQTLLKLYAGDVLQTPYNDFNTMHNGLDRALTNGVMEEAQVA
jgi:hypothetical protein